MTYKLCKKVIENSINRGTLDKEDMLVKLDVFLLGNRITKEEYQELVDMVNMA